jgi:hypothetical protein
LRALAIAAAGSNLCGAAQKLLVTAAMNLRAMIAEPHAAIQATRTRAGRAFAWLTTAFTSRLHDRAATSGRAVQPPPHDRTRGELAIAADLALSRGDIATFQSILGVLADWVVEPLHCDLVELAVACDRDLHAAIAVWPTIRERAFH